MIRYIFIILLILINLQTDIVFASIDGFTGRTLKNSTRGCGNCHGSNASGSVEVTLTGPDTVYLNQSTTFILTISGGSASGSGCGIAVRYGSLSPISSALKLSGGELTHKTNTAMSGGLSHLNFAIFIRVIKNGIRYMQSVTAPTVMAVHRVIHGTGHQIN